MSRIRPWLLSAALLGALSLSGATTAHAATSTAPYTCQLPTSLASAPVAVTVTSTVDVPTSVPAGEEIRLARLALDVALPEAKARALRARGVATLESPNPLTGPITDADGTDGPYLRHRLTVGVQDSAGIVLHRPTLRVPVVSLADQPETAAAFQAVATLPPLTVTAPGISIKHDSFVVQLVARDASGNTLFLDDNGIDGGGADADATTFQVKCTATPVTPEPLIASISTDAPADVTPPSVPTEVTMFESDFTATSINLRWGASTDEPGGSGLKEYVVRFEDQEIRVPAGTTQKLIAGLGPDGEHIFSISAVDHAGNESDPLELNFSAISDPCWVFQDCPTPLAPINATASLVTQTSARVQWTAPNDSTIAKYRVDIAGQAPVFSSGAHEVNLTGLTPGTAYTATVSSISQDPTAEPSAPASVSFTTVSVEPVTETVDYDVTGSIGIGSIARGFVIVQKGGSALLFTKAKTARTASQDVSGTLTLGQAQGRLVALGFLPVTAKLAFVSSGAATGTLEGGVLSLNQKLRIKVLEAKLFGAIPLAGGNNCQTKSLSDVNLKSTAAAFEPSKGGPLAGKFTISDLNGCGALNGLVSPLTAGTNNTIALGFAPKAIG